MHLTTDLPLATLFFKHWDIDDTEVGVVIAKARFQRGADDHFWVTDAPELVLAEVFDGDPAVALLLTDQDIAPGKVGTDLLIHATARAPGGRALPDWPVAVSIVDRLTYGFQVRGPAIWQKQRQGWRQTAPDPIVELPITYTLAFGGQAQGRDGMESHAFNPAGIGFTTPALLQQDTSFAAAQIGDLADFMTTDPQAIWMVHGFGPVAKAWLPRRGHAGTFDAAWKQTRHPRMPRDYSYRFWNAANGPLQLADGLVGNEVITVMGVSLDGRTQVQLPGAQLALFVGADAVMPMPLDNFEIEMRQVDPADHTVMLTWRLRVADAHVFGHGIIATARP